MTPAELDEALNELETRLERLRALYEQYFLGIEKVPPAVLRKDVDRRFYQMRREQIRNTAKRFKLQTLVQRYNTFQQYWMRICREIEEGTYRRHLLRARRRQDEELLTIAARRRAGAFGHRASRDGEDGSSDTNSAPPEAADAMTFEASLSEALGLSHDAAGNEALPRASSMVAREASEGTATGVQGRCESGRAQPQSGPPSRRAPFHSLSVPTGTPPPRPGTSSTVRSPAGGPPTTRPDDRTPSPLVAAPKTLAQAALAGPRPNTPEPRTNPDLPGRRTPGGIGARGSATPPTTAVSPVTTTAAHTASRSMTGPQDSGDLSALHRRLLAAKRETNDSTPISLDSLGRKLEATRAKLRAQHGDREVHFDVVIREGRALIKPRVR